MSDLDFVATLDMVAFDVELTAMLSVHVTVEAAIQPGTEVEAGRRQVVVLALDQDSLGHRWHRRRLVPHRSSRRLRRGPMVPLLNKGARRRRG